MSGVYEVVDVLNTEFRDVGFKHISFGDPSEVDLNKQNIYPLMHITLTSVTHGENYQSIVFDLVWVDVIYEGKPLDKRTTLDEMSNVSNVQDIFHDLNYRISGAFQKFKGQLPELVEVQGDLVTNALFAKAQNKLAGYEGSFTVIIPTICQM